MGKIGKRRRLSRRVLRIAQLWAVPVIVAGLFLFGTNLVVADTSPTASELQQYLTDNALVVHNAPVGGYQQVYYLYNRQSVFITSDNTNHLNPKTKGNYVVWLDDGSGTTQVFLYNLLTKSATQLSSYSTNNDVDLDGNHVVWDQALGDTNAQVMYYDGFSVQSISISGDAMRPRISGNKIAYTLYAPNDPSGHAWHVVEYDTSSGQNQTILTTSDPTNAWPHFNTKGQLLTHYDQDYLTD